MFQLCEPPTLVLPLTKKSANSKFLLFSVIRSLLSALAWHAKSPFCGTGAFTGAQLLADVPACQLHWKNNWGVRLGWEFPAFLSPHNEVKMGQQELVLARKSWWSVAWGGRSLL